MTATDELRRLLDERGVEWTEGIARPELTQVRIDGKVVKFHPWQPNTLKVSLFDITPAQAIAATLGREPDDAAMAKLHDQMNAAMLKYEMAQGIEKRDGDGAIVVPWVLKMHALLEEAATLGSCNCTNDCTNSERTETCHADETGRFSFHVWNGELVTVHVMECSECGGTYEHVNGGYEFCPRCGRKVVGE